jgi:hypothetical protein
MGVGPDLSMDSDRGGGCVYFPDPMLAEGVLGHCRGYSQPGRLPGLCQEPHRPVGPTASTFSYLLIHPYELAVLLAMEGAKMGGDTLQCCVGEGSQQEPRGSGDIGVGQGSPQPPAAWGANCVCQHGAQQNRIQQSYPDREAMQKVRRPSIDTTVE